MHSIKQMNIGYQEEPHYFFWLLDFNKTIYEPPVVKARSKEFLNGM
jgi:hypothetical protein